MSKSTHQAGAFDIRNVIGTLLGIYGVVLVICSFVLNPGYNPDLQVQKQAADNLWVGIALIVVAVAFFAWTKFRPIIVEEEQ